MGGDTRSGLGRPRAAGRRLSSAALSGVVFYAPAEMTLCARAGTTIEAIETAIGEHNQILPFEPMRSRKLWASGGEPTLGGMVATNLSGPRRLSAGAVRDCVLGLRLVNGLGQAIQCGGRVMKNVTGLDLTKLNCGAHGTLGFVVEATIKLAPKPERETTLVIPGLDDDLAIEVMTRALGSPFGLSGAAWIDAGMGMNWRARLLRLEGFEEFSRLSRRAADRASRGVWANHSVWPARNSTGYGARFETPSSSPSRGIGLSGESSVAPSRAAALVARLGETALAHCYDWGGGLDLGRHRRERGGGDGLPPGSSAHRGACDSDARARWVAGRRGGFSAPFGTGAAAQPRRQIELRPRRRVEYRPHVRRRVRTPCRPSSHPRRSPIRIRASLRAFCVPACIAASAPRPVRPMSRSAMSATARAGGSI